MVFSMVLISFALGSATTRTGAFTLPRHPARPSSRDGGTRRHGRKPDWLDDAMGTPPPPPGDAAAAGPPELPPGLAGFALSEDRGGFFALLASNDARFVVPVLVSQADGDRVTSPESMTLVQLAGGLDLGTAVLPPDALLTLAVDALPDDKEDDARDREAELRRSRLTLSKIRVVSRSQTPEAAPAAGRAPVARNPAVPDTLATEVLIAVHGLPGLQKATQEQVEDAVHAHAGRDGRLDRDGFSALLRDVRAAQAPAARHPAVTFALTGAAISGERVRELAVETASAITALGLALRYRVDIEVDDATDMALPATRLLEEFPTFRPLEELEEDARIMDGFIPTMFAKTKSIDNDDKAQ